MAVSYTHLALDITAKHVDDHIGYLDEEEFRRTVWHHRPITDVWNIGPGIARRLEKYGVHDLFGICWLDALNSMSAEINDSMSFEEMLNASEEKRVHAGSIVTVSYTHLDVYKRQVHFYAVYYIS